MLVATCDDELQYCEQVEAFMTRLGDELGIETRCDKYKSGAELLNNPFHQYQIIFLDIDMKDENGIDIAEKIRESSQEIEIIFLTAFIQYAVEGYKVRAYRFLVKPIDYDDFVFQVKELLVRLHQKGEGRLTVTKEGQDYTIPIEDILYIEVMNHTLTYHCTKYDMTVSGTMTGVEKRLKDHCFARIHNSYAVNMRRIEKVRSQSVVLRGGTTLPLARSKKDAFRRLYLEFWGDELG